jgi:hypothetical protein
MTSAIRAILSGGGRVVQCPRKFRAAHRLPPTVRERHRRGTMRVALLLALALAFPASASAAGEI